MSCTDLKSLSNAGVVKLEITADDLLKLVQNVAKETAEFVLFSFKENQSPELLTRKQARDLLNVKTDLTMIRWEEKGYLVPHKICSRVFYRKNEVIAAAERFSRNGDC